MALTSSAGEAVADIAEPLGPMTYRLYDVPYRLYVEGRKPPVAICFALPASCSPSAATRAWARRRSSSGRGSRAARSTTTSRTSRTCFRAVHEELEQELVGVDRRADRRHRGPLGAARDRRARLPRRLHRPGLMQISLLDAPGVLGWEEWREIDARYGLGLVTVGLQNAMDAGLLRKQDVEPAGAPAARRDERGGDADRERVRPEGGATRGRAGRCSRCSRACSA